MKTNKVALNLFNSHLRVFLEIGRHPPLNQGGILAEIIEESLPESSSTRVGGCAYRSAILWPSNGGSLWLMPFSAKPNPASSGTNRRLMKRVHTPKLTPFMHNSRIIHARVNILCLLRKAQLSVNIPAIALRAICFKRIRSRDPNDASVPARSHCSAPSEHYTLLSKYPINFTVNFITQPLDRIRICRLHQFRSETSGLRRPGCLLT